jgi:hypothetical protein
MYQHPDNIRQVANDFIRLGIELNEYSKQVFELNDIKQCHIRLTISTSTNTQGITYELCASEYFGVTVKGHDPLAVLDEFCRRNGWYNLNKPITTKLISACGNLDEIVPPELPDIPF